MQAVCDGGTRAEHLEERKIADTLQGSAAAYTCRQRSLSGWPPRDSFKTFHLLRPNTWLVLATWVLLHSTSTIDGNYLVGMMTSEAWQATMKAGYNVCQGTSGLSMFPYSMLLFPRTHKHTAQFSRPTLSSAIPALQTGQTLHRFCTCIHLSHNQSLSCTVARCKIMQLHTLHVPVQTRPAVEVTTHSHYWLSGNFITYVAFVSTAIEHLIVIPSRTSRKRTVVTSLCGHTCRGRRQRDQFYYSIGTARRQSGTNHSTTWIQ